MNKKTILSGALVLSIAGIITRLMGFAYRIYMSNAIGAEGIGLYQLVLPIYGLVWSISCSGITTTISKLIAQEKIKGEWGNVKLILRQCTFIAVSVSVILSFIVFSYAKFIAITFFKDTRIVLSLQLLSMAFPLMAWGSCLRGYFFGIQKNIVPAINQVFEQSVRMLFIFMLADFFIPLGIEFACAVAILGIVAEETFSFIYIILSYKKNSNKTASSFSRSKWYPSFTSKEALYIILCMSLPLTANRVIGSLLSTFENILIPQMLQEYGMSPKEAISTFGRITGMAMPLIFFPTSFLMSLSVSLVPAISEASTVKNIKDIKFTVSKCMLFASIVGFGSSALFIIFSFELGDIIYNQNLSNMLTLLGLTCPFLYMQIILSGVLNGLGYQVFIFRNSIISSLITISSIYFLIPKMGINGFFLGIFLSVVVVCMLEVNKVLTDISIKLDFSNWFLKPLLSAVASGLVTKLLFNKFILFEFNRIASLIFAIIFLSIMYTIFIILTDTLSIKEIIHIIKSITPKSLKRKLVK